MFVGIYVLYNILPNGSYRIEVFKIKKKRWYDSVSADLKNLIFLNMKK